MVRRLALILVCGLLAVGGLACAPPRGGPTTGAGYVLILQVADPMIWLGPVDAAVARQFPQVTAVIVEVQDAQGHLVEDVPVTFEVEPEWVSSITLAPAQTRTRRGQAQTVVSDPQTTGIVRVAGACGPDDGPGPPHRADHQRKSAD